MKRIWTVYIFVVMRWLLANAVFPILVPVAVLVVGDCFFADKIDVFKSARGLLYEGFYIFSSMALIFSLFEDFSTFQKAITPLAGMMLMLPMLGVCILFYATQKYGVGYFEERISLFFIVWISIAIYATVIKCKMIRYKQKYRY